MNTVPGFLAGAVSAGIKKDSGHDDFGLLYSKTPARAAAVFTTNVVKAAPVVVGMGRIRNGLCQAVVVNSGNANACTGQQGTLDAEETAAAVAVELGIDPSLVIPSSTGVIGVPLPMKQIKEAVPALVSSLREDGLEDFARAITTTDGFPKFTSSTTKIGGKTGTVSVVGKGAGMIAPNMATMLSFTLTDIDIAPSALKTALKTVVEESYNKIIVDGDISTNDTALILSNGALGNSPLKESGGDYTQLLELLIELNTEIATMIVRDGEGATKVVKIVVKGAASPTDAEKIARAMGTSLLVKTALYGQDANWGRFVAAAGAAGVEFDPSRVDLYFDEHKMVENGAQVLEESVVGRVFKKPEFTVTLDIKSGSSTAHVITSDITHDYITLNADYRT
ncbi:MAG: bifunctional glutamate N-acetyltransferase/amino-acid acetyltransferase ArgJ [Thermodesulfobacteriota bacterium]